MTSANRTSRPRQPRQRGRDTGEASGWQELRSRLQAIADELRRVGLADKVDGFEQVAQLVYLKLLDEGQPAKGSRIFSGMTSRFRWSSFRGMEPIELHRFVKDHVLSYLGSLSIEAPMVSDYYRSATLKIEDPGAFKRIVELIDGIDFVRLKPDEMGRILEYLFAEARYTGEFRTPHHLRALMISLVDPVAGESIYDPACGTGGFLTDAVSYVLAKSSSAPREVPIYGEDWPRAEGDPPLQTWKVEGGKLGIDRSQVGRLIHGNDISWRMTRIASMNLALQRIGTVDVRRANSLSNFGGLSPTEMEQKHDVVLCAPAFGDAPSHEAIRSDLPIPSTRMELLFLEIAMESLAPGGRCAIIVPENVLFGEGSTTVEVRKRLLSTCEVLAVISLPPAIFRPYSAVKTSILVFRRSVRGPSRSEYVWFYDVEHDGYDLDRSPQPDANDIPELLTRWGSFVASEYTRPPGPEAANMRRAEPPSHCWWARRETIESNQFDLTAKRYKPRFYSLSVSTPKEQLTQLVKTQASFLGGTQALQTLLIMNSLPSGWSEQVRHKKLDELVKVVSGRTPSTTEPSYWEKEGKGVPWASPKDMKQYVLSDTQDHVTQSAVDNVPLTVVKPGAVLVVVRSMILIHSIPVAVNAVPLVISQDIKALCPREDVGIDVWYLFAYLKSVEDVLLASTQGTSHGSRSLMLKVILDLDVPVPPAAICTTIGQVMRDYVTLVDATERIRRDIGALFPSMLHTMFDR